MGTVNKQFCQSQLSIENLIKGIRLFQEILTSLVSSQLESPSLGRVYFFLLIMVRCF